jgi:nicotinate-nucleotide pyrophosphorylase (carboxylating)
MPEPPNRAVYADLIAQALAEDIGPGDITTLAIVSASLTTTGALVAKKPIVVAGLLVARDVFLAIDPSVEFLDRVKDGDRVTAGTELATLAGSARSLLTAERTALNLLQHLSGIATATRAYVDAAAGGAVILDTRKTVPGLRLLAKYAVRCGGGRNHRVGLFDGVLIKDNHIRIAGSVAEAVRRVRAAGLAGPIEVEAQSAAQVDDALAENVDVIMLDNFDDAATIDAVKRVGGRAKIELSGNMTEARVAALAGSGADFISVGSLTHSAAASDISLELGL